MERATHGLGLLRRECDAGLGLVASDGAVSIETQRGDPAAQQAQQARGCGHLGAKQPHLEHPRALGRALDGQIPGAAQAVHGRFHQRGFNFQ